MKEPNEKIRLFDLTQDIQQILKSRYDGRAIWIKAQITDVKKQTSLRRCYLKFVEKQGNDTLAEVKGVFWTNTYQQIEIFEKSTGKSFSDGLEISCLVMVKFHPRFGLSLEVQEIEVTYALGSLELERQQTLERLLTSYPETIRLVDGEYITENKLLELPGVIRNIALVTAMNSDGQRDFLQELKSNKYGYSFNVTEYLTQIQGDEAHLMIINQLNIIQASEKKYDIVAIIRGGGSQTDFKPFDHFDLAAQVAHYPIPVLTGIGHDRNTSITDLMTRQEKTPTKVAARILDHNFTWETELLELKERFFQKAASLLETARDNLNNMSRIIKAASPETVLGRGFSIIRKKEKIITDPSLINENDEIDVQLKDFSFRSEIKQKKNYQNI